MEKGKRVEIRRATRDDSEFFYRLYQDKETAFYSGLHHFFGLRDAHRFLEGLIRNPLVIPLVIVTSDRKEPIGTISLTKVTLYNKGAIEVGYATLPKWRSLGLTKEALLSVFDTIRKTKNFEEFEYLTAKYYLTNYKSARLLKSLGFEVYQDTLVRDGYGEMRYARLVFRHIRK